MLVVTCDGFDAADISLYTSAGYIMVVISAFVVLVSFFGCCGAWKESKCMLGTYFTIILALFIVMLVGAILGYSGDFEKTIKKPLKDSLKEYNDQPQSDSKKALKSIWNEVQEELKCCGVDGVTDWSNGNGTSFNWESNFNKPEGCCQYKRGDGDKLSQVEIDVGFSLNYLYLFKILELFRLAEKKQILVPTVPHTTLKDVIPHLAIR